jgi:ABC-type multidrug transport system fused ATPase/permease subunit
MAVHNMHVGTILYFGAALAIGVTLIVLGTMLNTQLSGNCNNTVKHSILGVIGLGVTLSIISILMFIVDRYCACTSAIGLFTLGSNITNIGFFAILTMIISAIAITLGGVIDKNLDKDCGENVNKNLAKYIWIGGLISLVLSLVISITNRIRSSDSSTDQEGKLQGLLEDKEKEAKMGAELTKKAEKAAKELKEQQEKNKKVAEDIEKINQSLAEQKAEQEFLRSDPTNEGGQSVEMKFPKSSKM